ncbi:MAG: hypothetical protein R3253_15235 [Longimicrobiales bacterium]|nr:hypothetical protein [Longimicrobiales bacterium]
MDLVIFPILVFLSTDRDFRRLTPRQEPEDGALARRRGQAR